MKSMTKGIVALMFGALLAANVNAQTGYWEQAQQQQREQQEQANRQAQEMLRQQNDEYYRQQQEAEAKRRQEREEYDKQQQAEYDKRRANTSATRYIPSSYGAVAWGNGYYGSASKQPTKQASIDLALQRCGNQACKVNVNYSNQCVALSYGKLSNGKYRWTPAFGITQAKAEKSATSQCNKQAKNCQILLSECSPAGEFESTQQYKGLGE